MRDGRQKEKTCLTSLEGHVVATKFKKEKTLEEKHTLTKMKTKISKYQKLKTKKTKKQQTERKALVQKDCILICPGSVQYSILLHAKHFPFQSGFPLFSFSVKEKHLFFYYFVFITLHCISCQTFNVLQLIPHAGYLPTSLFTALQCEPALH